MRLRHIPPLVYMTLIGGIGVAVGFGICFTFFGGTSSIQADCQKNFPLINPTVDCGAAEQKYSALQDIDSTVDAAVDSYIKAGKAHRVSVWVRDLTTQRWASTNENDRYAPASLLKVPLMIAYYKLAEIEPSVLSTKYTYQLTTEDSIKPEFPPEKTLVPGQQYTAEQLIEQMIVYSDNNAADVLAANLSLPYANTVFSNLGIVIPDTNGTGTYDFVTARTYASIFRSLYNASYLNEQYSEKALDLLAQTTFEAFSNTLPPGTTVADKFGERGYTNQDGSQERELHECGIIYKPGNPYILCIMTSGSNEDDLEAIIEHISSVVYAKM